MVVFGANVFACKMSINLRSVDAGVSQQFLDVSQLCAAMQEVRRETVSEGVWRYSAVESCFPAIALQDQPETLTRQSASSPGSGTGQGWASIPAGRDVLRQCRTLADSIASL